MAVNIKYLVNVRGQDSVCVEAKEFNEVSGVYIFTDEEDKFIVLINKTDVVSITDLDNSHWIK